MARLIWVGVGAVGGIYAYRKGEQAVDVVREQGVLGTAQIVAAAALHSAVALRRTGAPEVHHYHQPGLRVGRYRITRTPEVAPLPQPAAIMDSGVLDITDSNIGGTTLARRRPAATPRRKAR